MSSSSPVVLITGCSSGIGFALANEFDKQGCVVYASARRLLSLSALPERVHKLELDVGKVESCKAAVDRIIAEQARIDILVNNAGQGGTGALLDADYDGEEGAKAVFDTNFFAPLRLSKLVVPHMVERRSGLIINIGSIVGNVPTPWSGIYSASKAALHSATETLRMEVKGFGINVFLVAPGAITSEFGRKQLESIKTPEESLYKHVEDKIIARANASQQAGHGTVPASVLAEGVVRRALRPDPPTFWTVGGRSFLFFLLERIPRPVVWFGLSRMLGSDQVGKTRTPAEGEGVKTRTE
ncbi:hypothetical protein JCM8097_005862 [Rhodosporidiobolus ruineniae]